MKPFRILQGTRIFFKDNAWKEISMVEADKNYRLTKNFSWALEFVMSEIEAGRCYMFAPQTGHCLLFIPSNHPINYQPATRIIHSTPPELMHNEEDDADFEETVGRR